MARRHLRKVFCSVGQAQTKNLRRFGHVPISHSIRTQVKPACAGLPLFRDEPSVDYTGLKGAQQVTEPRLDNVESFAVHLKMPPVFNKYQSQINVTELSAAMPIA